MFGKEYVVVLFEWYPVGSRLKPGSVFAVVVVDTLGYSSGMDIEPVAFTPANKFLVIQYIQVISMGLKNQF